MGPRRRAGQVEYREIALDTGDGQAEQVTEAPPVTGGEDLVDDAVLAQGSRRNAQKARGPDVGGRAGPVCVAVSTLMNRCGLTVRGQPLARRSREA